MRVLMLLVLLSSNPVWGTEPAAASTESTVGRDALRVDGSSAESFAKSRSALEADMSDAARLAFHMRLAEIRNKLAAVRGVPLSDAEFGAALDGKTLIEIEAMADSAPMQITIDLEPHDDT